MFTQYANLYPVMGRLLDLSDYESVCACRELLLLAYDLPITDPNSMPVTRDLSTAKRAAIVRWLREPGPDGKPLAGTPPHVRAAAVVTAPAAAGPSIEFVQGGKAAAAARTLARRIERAR